MLGNCEKKKMVVISSTNNQWPQMDDQKGLMASNHRVAMDQKPINQDQTTQQQQQQQQQQQALKCPRCDSSNTKFCYYNNYSLTQPRHFCKACKRYWTRGGTLRNVPVGGGCRKNKRVKSRPSSNDAPSSSSSTPTSTVNTRIMNHHHHHHHHQPHIDHILSSSSNHIGNSNLFYGLPTNPYPSFNSRVSSLNPLGHGLGFSSGLDDDYRSGFNSNSLLSSSYSMFGSSSTSSSSTTTTTSPSMASIIASSLLQQQKYTSNGFPGLIGAYENLQMVGPGEGGGGGGGGGVVIMNQTANQINGSSDPSLYWNSTNVGAWLDPTNLGPSVPSLI